MPKKLFFLTLLLILPLGIYYARVTSAPRPTPPLPPLVQEVEAAPEPPSQISPDGTRNLSLQSSGESTIILADDKPVTTLNYPLTDINIPLNTWSPDNKYFFIQAGDEYLVMLKSGELVSLTTAFRSALPDFTLADVTGWAAPYLVVVNATDTKETPVSFWFDTSTRKFIRLSTYFN